MATETIDLISTIVTTVSLDSGISIDTMNFNSGISPQVDGESEIIKQIDLESEVLE